MTVTTCFIESVYSVGQLFSRTEVKGTDFGRVRRYIHDCQQRANEEQLDVVFKGLTESSLEGYRDYFNVCNGIIARANNKTAEDYEWYFTAYIPLEVLKVMQAVEYT